MRTYLFTILAVVALTMPVQAYAQSGDASWLNSIEGLELAIGRSWMAPLEFETGMTTTDFNDQGTPIAETTTHSTPIGTDPMHTLSLSALLYQFDSPDHAAEGLELLNGEQLEQLRRDPRNPATNEFDAGDLGDAAYAYEGVFEAEGMPAAWSEFAVVILLVQLDSVVYQIFGQFLPGSHTQIATSVASNMLAAESGSDEPVYDMNGGSRGGLWEKLNAADLAMPEGSTIYDLEIYPLSEGAVRGGSVVMPAIDLEDLGNVPGSTGSWHIAYGEDDAGTAAATPMVTTTDAFSIELWVLVFKDATHASAAAYALNETLIEPLGIVATEGMGFSSEDEAGLTLVSTGFVRDKSLPEGDAAVVVSATGSTVYAARVYSRETAPTPIARDLMSAMQATPVGEGEEEIEGLLASGGGWNRFPQVGDPLLRGLVPIKVHGDTPATPAATPSG